ncbi:unknown protein [Seminavis robusta]|uniref:Uncharacterized protein n=1 Tax=Seminavis robusta TaxID=568900 RepID=A0A9N8HKR7_9STRA|nr:unknown protein [Seminavis robusta]|eukprot:Sro631_g178550.1 n/a (294) ;mRNA; r:40453-41467
MRRSLHVENTRTSATPEAAATATDNVGLLMTQDFQYESEEDNEANDCDSDDGQLHDEAVLNCCFHVIQPFAKKNSYYKKLKNRDFAITRKEKPKGSLQGTAFSHVSNIAKTKSIEQRRTVTELYMNHWRAIGEHEAAIHFTKEYCVYPRWNWNYCCSDECGVYPSNCPNESFNRHGIKSVCADNAKNASLTHFLVHTARSLLTDDAHGRSDPCTIVIPDTCSPLMVTVTGFVCEGIDVIEMGRDHMPVLIELLMRWFPRPSPFVTCSTRMATLLVIVKTASNILASIVLVQFS